MLDLKKGEKIRKTQIAVVTRINMSCHISNFKF